jgi:hypothetical protein
MGVWKFEEKFGQGGHVLEPTSKSWLHQPKKVGIKNKEVWEKPFENFLSNLLNLAPTFGRVKSSIPHGAWRFHFFPKFFLLKLKYTTTFISTVGIFVYWNSEIVNSLKIPQELLVYWKSFVPFFSARCIWVCSIHPLLLRFGTQLLTWCALRWCKTPKLHSSKFLHQRW